MTGAVLLILAVILISNLYKLSTVSWQVISIFPTYLEETRSDPEILGDPDNRAKLQAAFTKIFFSIQIHALNVFVLIMSSWVIWEIDSFLPSSRFVSFIIIICIISLVANIAIAGNLITRFISVFRFSVRLKKLYSSMGQEVPEESLDAMISIPLAINTLGAIAMYLIPALASVGLGLYCGRLLL